ncbi:MAG: ribosome-associated translation inhibitor RaiA [Gammaproteobacteria bacterium]
MQLNLTGHHVDITPSMREYVESKLGRLERHFDHVTVVHCILTVDKLRHRSEATVNLSGGQLFAEATEENMYAAIDSMVSKLDRQVRKHKEKLTDHHARDTTKRDLN